MKINLSQDLDEYGIYKVINTINNNFYIGSTTESFHKRINTHKASYNKWIRDKDYKASSPLLYKAFKKIWY